MALPVSGYSARRHELLFVECDGFTIALKGPRTHPNVGPLCLHRDITSAVQVDGLAYRTITTPDFSTEAAVAELAAPLFFEETNYELIVEKTDDGPPIEFWHRDQALRSAYGPVGRSGKVSSVIINFGSQVGYSELKFTRGAKDVLSVTLEVFPTKLDYQKDWRALLERISSALYSLAYGFLTSTFQKGHAVPEPTKTLGQWYALLEPRFDTLLQSVDLIARSPNRRIVREQRVRPLAQVRRPDRLVRKWLQRHPAMLQPTARGVPGAIRTIAGPRLPVRLPESKARLSYDTRENRFLRSLLHNMVRQLGRLEICYVALCGRPSGSRLDQEFLDRLKSQQGRLRARLQYDFLSEVGTYHPEGALSTVLQFAPGYRSVFELGLILQLGLAFSEGIERIELKNVHELYEIWCFLELDALLSELTVAKSDIRTPFASKELFWALVRDRQGGARYRSTLGDEIVLQYNHSQATPTGAQRPDNLLSIDKNGAAKAFRFILDAKYRINADNQRVGPVLEDINAMHRYRDAIVTDHGDARRTVTEAVVLFPWRDEEEYRNNPFYRSIAKVGVGALPFLPGSRALVMDLIRRWITEPTDELDDRAVGVERHGREGLVLLGPISPVLSLDDVNSLGFYHVPKKSLVLEGRPMTHVALYEPKRDKHGGIVRALYSVKGWEVVPRNTLLVPGRSPGSSEPYYRIDLNVG